MNGRMVAVAGAILLAACGGGSSNPPDGGGGGSGGGAGGGTAGGSGGGAGGGSGGGSGATSPIDGTWKIACQAYGNNNGGPPGASAQVQTLLLGGGSFTFTQQQYSDTGCSTAVLTLTEAGTFAVGAADTDNGAPTGAVDVSFVQSAYTATSLNSTETTLLNTSGSGNTSVCSGVTFVTNSAVSVAGANCNGAGGGSDGGSNNNTQPANGATLVNFYLLNTTSTPNTLELGESNGGSNLGNNSGGRSTSVGSTFSKQ